MIERHVKVIGTGLANAFGASATTLNPISLISPANKGHRTRPLKRGWEGTYART
jgi:hypothetical protein